MNAYSDLVEVFDRVRFETISIAEYVHRCIWRQWYAEAHGKELLQSIYRRWETGIFVGIGPRVRVPPAYIWPGTL